MNKETLSHGIGYALIEDNKILIARNKYNNANGIPIVYGTYEDIEKVMLEEFTKFVRIEKIFRSFEIPMLIEGKMHVKTISIYYVTNNEHYSMEPDIEKIESGFYTDKKLVTYEEAKKMFLENNLIEHSFSIIQKLKDEGKLK